MPCGPWSLAVNRWLRTGVVLLVAAIAGFAGYYLSRANFGSEATELATQRLLLAPFKDLDGRAQTLSQRRGKVLVVNFWAPWCPPCREEIPELQKIQRRYATKGVEIVGIALDNASNVRNFAIEMNIDYVLLIAGVEALGLTKELGNAAEVLPFTVVLDREAKLAYAHAGALTQAKLDPVLQVLL